MLVKAKHKSAKDQNGNPLIATFEKVVWQTKIMQGGEWNFVQYVEEPANFKPIAQEPKASTKVVVTTKSCCNK